MLPKATLVNAGNTKIAQDFGAFAALDADLSNGPVVTCSLFSDLVEIRDWAHIARK